MRLEVHLLFPFDLGLELDFVGKVETALFKEVSTRGIPPVSLEGMSLPKATLSSQLYRFGVGMIQISFPYEGDPSSFAQLSCQADRIAVGRNNITTYCRSLVDGLISRAQKFATYRYEKRFSETEIFPVFVLNRNEVKNADHFVSKHYKALFGTISSEQNFDALSDFVMQQMPLANFGYYQNDLILIRRFGAVIASEEAGSILELIRLAHAQAWSLRAYNFLLNSEIAQAQKLLEYLPPYYMFWRIPGRYKKFATEALDFGRDKLSIIDSLYYWPSGMSQIESDWHLRTVYKSIENVFDVEGLYQKVYTKIDQIEKSYSSASDYLSTNFFILLDFIFFFWLAWSVFDSYLLWRISQKDPVSDPPPITEHYNQKLPAPKSQQ